MTLREIKNDPDQAIVALLDDLLERAKQGEILGIAIAMHMTGRETATVFALGDGSEVAFLVLALEHIKLRLLEAE